MALSMAGTESSGAGHVHIQQEIGLSFREALLQQTFLHLFHRHTREGIERLHKE